MNEFRTSDLKELKDFLDLYSQKIGVALRKRSDLLSSNTSSMNSMSMQNDIRTNPEDYYLVRIGRFELSISYNKSKYYDIVSGNLVYKCDSPTYKLYICQLFGDPLDLSSVFPHISKYRDNHIYIGSYHELSEALTSLFEVVILVFEEVLKKKSNIEIIRSLF